MKLCLSIYACLGVAASQCLDPTPAFSLPVWGDRGIAIGPSTIHALEGNLTALLANDRWNTSAVSIQLTSQTTTLWSWYHSAREVDAARPGVEVVDGDSQYRIASISKTFTVLALLHQHAAGNLSLDDPISNYVPELAGDDAGDLPWKDITLRALASQLSGLPREFALFDVLATVSDPTELGLPPANISNLSSCVRNEGMGCSRSELLNQVKQFKPLFAPNQKSTYSNLNYDLLGIVLENVSGQNYSELMHKSIFEPLSMDLSSCYTPSDKHAVLPASGSWWDRDLAIQKPTGGIYSSASDLSKYLRYVLTHYNTLATGVNWFNPGSFGTGPAFFYGMPWEIFRTTKILPEQRRPVTFVNKGGSLPGHYSEISLLPEYGLGFVFLTSGSSALLTELLELVTVTIVRAADKVIWEDVERKYTGHFVADKDLNSSISLRSSPQTGLIIDHFISNSTDVFAKVLPSFGAGHLPQRWRAQLIPTLLYKNESAQEGEIFRVQFVNAERPGEESKIWKANCATDLDLPANYAGLPLNELVFWHDKRTIELPAWRVKMKMIDTSGFLQSASVQQRLADGLP